MENIIIIEDSNEKVLEITKEIARCFITFFPKSKAYAVCDIVGEDHVYVIDENGKPIFDLLVSSARKFIFLWYYIRPEKGMEMVSEMKRISLNAKLDYAVKFPNIPRKSTGFPSIIRYGKKPAGIAIEKFIVKSGNPQLTEEIFTEENLNTYRSYDWHKVPNALGLILKKAKEMVPQRLKKNPKMINNVRGYCLYAGCAYHHLYPHLGFGMRDIDVQVFFSPKKFTNTRCAFTRDCDIEEFGRPEYFKGKTRWLDLMWNSFHIETGNFEEDVITYMNEMRHKSDRWATISQRPMINLENKKIIYFPKWLQKLEKAIKL